MSDKCYFCNGSGYQSAAQNMPSDTPSMLMPVGVWPCPSCHGAGKASTPFISEEDQKQLREALKHIKLGDSR